MRKMIQQLKYMILIFSIFFIVFGVQSGEYYDEELKASYILSKTVQPCNNVFIATYDDYNLVMTKVNQPCNDRYTVTLNGKIIAEKTVQPCNNQKSGSGVLNWDKFPFGMTKKFISDLRPKSNLLNHSNQQLLQQPNNNINSNNQQQVIIKQQQKLSAIDLENMKQKIAENEKIISRIDLNIDKNSAGCINSFEGLNTLTQVKDHGFLFVELSTKHKYDSSIDSIIHAVWLSWLINTAIDFGTRSALSHVAQGIIKNFGCTDFSVQHMKIFIESIAKENTKINCINFLKNYKNQYVCKKNTYQKEHDCKKQSDCQKINIWQAPEDQMLYLVTNSIVHLICDNNYNLTSNSEYVDLFIHIKNLKTNNKYAFVLIIQCKDGSIIECLVNKVEKSIEIVTVQPASDDFKKFIKNLLGDSVITLNFLEKEIIRLEQKNTENVKCAQQILENLGIEKDLIKKFIKIPEEKILVESSNTTPPVVVQQIVTLKPNEQQVTGWKILDFLSLAWKYPKTAACIGIPIMLWIASVVKKGAGELLVCGIVGILCLGKLIADKKI